MQLESVAKVVEIPRTDGVAAARKDPKLDDALNTLKNVELDIRDLEEALSEVPIALITLVYF